MLLRSYAKINLSLDIKGIREDGYHLVDTIMQKTSLYDELEINWYPDDSDSGVEIEIKTNKPYIPCDERNLAYKAVRLMESSTDKMLSGRVTIDIKKHIPVSAGLAGGSGNGAAVMIGLNRLWKLGYDTRNLCEIGKAMGADVPFMILVQNSNYKCAIGTGLGDELSPLPSRFRKHLVLAKPSFGVSTKEVYKGIDEIELVIRPDNEELISGLENRDYEKIYNNMINVLEEYTLKKYKAVSDLKEIIGNTAGCEKVLMSGSGPTVYGVYSSSYDARKACLDLRKMKYEAYWTDTFLDKKEKR